MDRLILMACLSVMMVSAHAAVYKWVDANGKVSYSDKPQPGSVKQAIKATSKEVLPAAEQESVKKLGGEKKAAKKKRPTRAVYCAKLVQDMEHIKNGGELIMVEKKNGKVEQSPASEALRRKSYAVAEKDYQEYCQ